MFDGLLDALATFSFDAEFFRYVAVGFIAQMVDGALGMAYGVTSTSFLLAAGVPPAAASASVHTAEVFTTGVSGLSHAAFRNIDRTLFLKLVLPGVLGAVVGAYVLTSLPEALVKPLVAVYLIVMGALILAKSWRGLREKRAPIRHVRSLGLVGGFLDAAGGGGWGPIVTSTLIARGMVPRYAIGTVSASEFFVTVAATSAFVMTIGFQFVTITFGLLVGGVLAAPLAAWVSRALPARLLMRMIGLVIVAISLKTALGLFF